MNKVSLLIIALVFLPFCSSKLVKKDEVVRISKDFEGIFQLKDKVDVGNFESLNKGAKVKLIFKAGGEFVSVAAYPYTQPREEAAGKIILQVFEGDFPNKKWSEDLFRARLSELVEEFKGKLETPVAAKGAKPADRPARPGKK